MLFTSTATSSAASMLQIKRSYCWWRFVVSLLVITNLQLPPADGSVEISNHIRTCCSNGLQHAQKNSYCHDYDFEVDAIPLLWRGLCFSTFGLCCSRELQDQHCVAGRLAALTGSRCSDKFNTTSYADCCRFCQVGLAVRASENSCSDEQFAYFAKDNSYNICCDEKLNVRAEQQKYKGVGSGNGDSYGDANRNLGESDVSTPGDGTIVLQDDDDDICGKVPNLCSHICENTQEAYVCKCNPGYQLDENGVTCSVIEAARNESGNSDEQSAFEGAPGDKADAVASDEVSLEERAEDDDGGDVLCPPGYERKRNKCSDIDECARNLAQCKISQYCHNTNGSYRCLSINGRECPEGFRLSSKTNTCEDINECEEGSDDCEADQACKNLKGSFNCQSLSRRSGLPGAPLGSRYQHTNQLHKCGSGFEFRSGRCIDINECLMDESVCDSSQVCTNDLGGYHCDCKIGFNLDTITNACVDINECSINNHNCLPTQRCDNTLGSYVCTRLQSCGTGYTFNAQTNNCDDDDECALNTHTCTADYTCHNTMGSFRCRHIRHSAPSTTPATSTTLATTSTSTAVPSRPQQYSPLRNQSYHVFPPSYTAHQTHTQNLGRESSPLYVDSAVASLPCGLGFHRNHLGACVDTNECQVSVPCGSHQRCINTNGSYRCQNLLQCGAGYKSTPDGSTCVDIDECETKAHNCAENQICRNRQGGYICACPPGHQLSRTPSGPGRCVDIDECEQEHPSVCPSNAHCFNTIGSYYCECKSGFQKSRDNERICLDVAECQAIPGLCQQKCVNFWGGYRCTCNAGYELNADNRTCNDLDECEVHKSYKLCMGFCNNVPGSYECSCPRGYTLAMDKTTCRDIDECASGNFCTGRNDICTNVRGTHKCTTIHCPYGYVNDPDQKNRCRQTSNLCDGEDCYNKPSAYTYNFITLVSRLQIPPEGRTIFSLHGPLWYDDIDFDLKIVKIQAAANIEKASENHFDTNKGKHEVHLTLKRSLEGPQDIELELSMTVFTNGMPRGKSVAKIFIIVSQYTF